MRSEYEDEAYWRDVGTVDAYWEANIDLTETLPALDLYDQKLADLDYSEVTPPPSSCMISMAGAVQPWRLSSRADASCRAPR